MINQAAREIVKKLIIDNLVNIFLNKMLNVVNPILSEICEAFYIKELSIIG